MTLTRGLIIAFWLFIAVSLLWQCSAYMATTEQRARAEAPKEAHYFYKPKPLVPPEVISGAKLVQTSFTILPETPSPGHFTCRVVIKNVGVKKATHIQVQVRPFYGGMPDEGESRLRDAPLTPDNRLWQISGSLGIPDLAPGQSCSPQSITFDNQPGGLYGPNYNPQIVFEEEKTPPAPAAKPKP